MVDQLTLLFQDYRDGVHSLPTSTRKFKKILYYLVEYSSNISFVQENLGGGGGVGGFICLSKNSVLQQGHFVELSLVILSMQQPTQLLCSIACCFLNTILNCFQLLLVASVTNNGGKGAGKLCSQII